jgi:hypothetical protein
MVDVEDDDLIVDQLEDDDVGIAGKDQLAGARNATGAYSAREVEESHDLTDNGIMDPDGGREVARGDRVEDRV